MLSDDRFWEMRAAAKSDPRTADEHWFVLYGKAIEAEVRKQVARECAQIAEASGELDATIAAQAIRENFGVE